MIDVVNEDDSRDTYRLRGRQRPDEDEVRHEHVRGGTLEFYSDLVSPMGEPELGARLLLHRAECLWGPAKEQTMGRWRCVPGVNLGLSQPQYLSARSVQRLPQVLAHRQSRATYTGTDEDPDPMPECDQARHDGDEQRNIAPALEHRHQDIPSLGHRAVLLPSD
jgi:hypothetical protein